MPKLKFGELQKIFAEMIDEGTKMLAARTRQRAMRCSFQRFLDLRYEGQEFAIKVPVSAEEIAAGDLQTIRDRFDSIHDRSFGHAAPNEPLEMVNIRLSARGIRQKLKMPEVAVGEAARRSRGRSARSASKAPIASRIARSIRAKRLSAGTEIEGPALIEEYGSTTVMFAGDRARISATGEIIIQLRAVQ